MCRNLKWRIPGLGTLVQAWPFEGLLPFRFRDFSECSLSARAPTIQSLKVSKVRRRRQSSIGPLRKRQNPFSQADWGITISFDLIFYVFIYIFLFSIHTTENAIRITENTIRTTENQFRTTENGIRTTGFENSL